MDALTFGTLKKSIDGVATGFDHAERTGDNTFSVYFIDGTHVDCTIPLPADGEDGITYEPAIQTVSTLPAGSSATASVSVEGTTAKYSFGIPQGAKGDKGDKGDGVYDDTEIRGMISALSTKVSELFDLVDDIHYITAETKASMVDPSTLEAGVYVCIVKQDEDYPKAEGEAGECYSTLYICVVDDTPSWEFIGKLNVSEKMLERLIASALTNYYTKAEVDEKIAQSGGGGNVYSDTETVVGTWFGKPLYRRAFQFTDYTYQVNFSSWGTGRYNIINAVATSNDDVSATNYMCKVYWSNDTLTIALPYGVSGRVYHASLYVEYTK